MCGRNRIKGICAPPLLRHGIADMVDREKRRKKTRLNYRRIAFAIFLLLVIVFLAFYFFFQRGLRSDRTIELKYGELDLSGDFSALIIRNEKVIYALSSGKTAYKLNEGDHLEKGDVVLEIELNGEIESVNRNDKTENLAITRRAILLELAEIRKSLLVDIERKKYEDAAMKKREFQSKHELLDKIVEGSSADESAREDYIGKNLVSVYSSLRGVLSFNIDGLEGVVSPSNIYTFDFSRINELPHKVNVAKPVVAKGEEIYKVIDDSNVMIAVTMPMDGRVETFTEADGFVVMIGNTELGGTLHESFIQGNNTICIIRLNSVFPSFFTSRILPCTVSPKGYKGLIVPSSALVEISGVRGVYRVAVNGLAEFVPVKVLKNESGSAIIQNSRFYNSKGELVQTVTIGQRVVRNASDFKVGDPVE